VKLKELHIAKDKATEKFSGFCHISYYNTKHAQAAIEKYHGSMLGNRQIFVSHCDAKNKIEAPWYSFPSAIANYTPQGLVEKYRYFQVPEKVQLEFVELFKKHNYSGKNISCIKQSWELTYNDKDKLDVGVWGFKNFLAALNSVPYFRVEREAPLLKPEVSIWGGILEEMNNAGATSSKGSAAADKDGDAKETFTAAKKKNIKKPLQQHKGSLTYVAYLR